MKKSTLLIFIILMISGIASAQKFYARVGLGLSGGTSANLDILYSYKEDGAYNKISVVPVDLGSGFNGALTMGYKLSKYFGLELGLAGFLGFPSSGDFSVTMPGGTNSKAKIYGSMFSLIPGVTLSPGLEKVNPYARFGMVIGVLPMIFGNFSSTQSSVYPQQEIKIENQYYGGVALGYTASLGVDFNLNKLVALFAEATFVGCSWSPSYSKITKYTMNGVDQLSTLNTKQKETEYYSTIDLSEKIPDTSPDKKLRRTFPFDNAGVNIGVKFKF